VVQPAPYAAYGAPQYAQPELQYMQQPMMPQQMPLSLPPAQQQQLQQQQQQQQPQQQQPQQQQQLMQQPYAQAPYATQYVQPPMLAQPQVPAISSSFHQVPAMPPMPAMPPPQVQANHYMTPGMALQSPDDQQRAAQAALMAQSQPPAVAGQAPAAQPDGQPPAGGDQQGTLLHITMHDWEPDQPGQLWVTQGTLVNVSYRAAHGWVYAGTVQPGNEGAEPASEGWIPQAVVKRVSLCRVAIDWPAEGTGTLGVTKGEIIAVSKQAERGWVYGERIGPSQPDRTSDGWLPRKVLDYLQA